MSSFGNFIDQSGVTRLRARGGGGGAIPSGAGSPGGTVTPSGIGALYVDTTDGGLYIATGATSADWTKVGGVTASVGDLPGASRTPDFVSVDVIGGVNKDTPLNGNGVVVSDAYAQWNGNGDGLIWLGNGTDGEQSLQVKTGGGTKLGTLQDKNGVFTSPGGIKFPTADPHVAGAWWDNAGTLTKSAG